jgi:hypothetical protein
MSRVTTSVAVVLMGAAAASFCGCAGLADDSASRLPPGYRLVQKREFQALYGPDGGLERLLRDKDGDGRADVVVLYGKDGNPARAEIDTDADGLVDRWELLRADGTLEAVGVSRRGSGLPDEWERATPDGRVVRELDADGGGTPGRAPEAR